MRGALFFDEFEFTEPNLTSCCRCRDAIVACPIDLFHARRGNALGDVLVAPITQGGDYSRYAGFAVSLMNTGCKTQGVALVNKCRMMDLSGRGAKKVERAPQAVVDDALGRLLTLFE